VEQALTRWESQGLVKPELAEALRREAEEAHREATSRWGQILVAALGAVALVLAAILFAQRNWENLGEAGRTAVLQITGGVVYLGGLVINRRASWRYSGLLLQSGGMGVVLSGLFYSAEAWSPGSGGAWSMAVLALLVPAFTARISWQQGPLMAGIHAAAGYGYLSAFLYLGLELEAGSIFWVLDALTLALVVGIPLWLRGAPADLRDRALTLLGVSLWAGLALALLTGAESLDMDEDAVLAMDVWLALIAAMTLWGIHRSPAAFRRAGYEINLALCVGVGGILMMWTGSEPLDGGIELGMALGGATGLAGMAYGISQRSSYVLVVGALTGLLASWIFAIDQAGATGGVVAMAVSAVVLFWVSTRIRTTASGRQAGPEDLL
jgi:hypothetical protein